jgi:hypothetical protein
MPEANPEMKKFLAIALAWATGVPAGLFIAGLALLWIGRGFQSSKQ